MSSKRSSDDLSTSDEEDRLAFKRPAIQNESAQLSSAGVAAGFITHKDKEEAQYSAFAYKQMMKMKHEAGKGLGKHGQGRVAPVEASKQRGNLGLGYKNTGFEADDTIRWDSTKEEIGAVERIEYLPSCKEPVPSPDTLTSWMIIDKKSETIEDKTDFVSEETLKNVIKCKSVFDNLQNDDMRRARTRANPFESIRGAIFQNRAAMKMANIDAVSNFMFTSPTDKERRLVVHPASLLYFADICAGPGGFSEYVLWRRPLGTKGFGFTLKGKCDFKLEDFYAAPSCFFEPHYGVGGTEGDGDIYSPENLKTFRKFVMKSTEDKGVHFVMGFDVEGKENLQEILSKRLYLCQCLCALSILRIGGHFVCKLFDIFTRFSVGLVYLMYRCFDEVAIFKPVTSRPANSERYLVCKGRREDSGVVHDYLFNVNEQMDDLWPLTDDESETDVMELVSFDVINDDDIFYDYILNSNEQLGRAQAISLAKIQVFEKNRELIEESQADMRSECLKLWQVPDDSRKAPSRVGEADAQNLFAAHMQVNPNIDWRFGSKLTSEIVKSLRSPYNYRCVVTGDDNRYYLVCVGKSVWKWNGQKGSKWQPANDNNYRLDLPRDTILEVEFITEYFTPGQRKQFVVHVVDAGMLFGLDISQKHYNERMAEVRKFVKALHRPTRPNLSPFKCKDVHKLEELEHVFQRLKHTDIKNRGRRQVYTMCDQLMHEASGLLITRTSRDPWNLELSRSRGKKYYYDMEARRPADMDITPEGAIAPFSRDRLFWQWTPSSDPDADHVTQDTVMDYLRKRR